MLFLLFAFLLMVTFPQIYIMHCVLRTHYWLIWCVVYPISISALDDRLFQCFLCSVILEGIRSNCGR